MSTNPVQLSDVDFNAVRKAFTDDSVFAASDQQLRSYIKGLAKSAIDNDRIKHQVGVMAQAVTQIQTSRLIERVNSQNLYFGWIVLAIAVLSFLSSLVQILVALNVIHS